MIIFLQFIYLKLNSFCRGELCSPVAVYRNFKWVINNFYVENKYQIYVSITIRRATNGRPYRMYGKSHFSIIKFCCRICTENKYQIYVSITVRRATNGRPYRMYGKSHFSIIKFCCRICTENKYQIYVSITVRPYRNNSSD